LPDSLWTIGPFKRPDGVNPVIKPNAATVFDCPLTKGPVHWEACHTFNPAAVVMNNEICVLYRAEDSSGTMKVGGHTSRLGLATSTDGINFVRSDTPSLYPANDKQKRKEWKGGCEDPRLVRTGDGKFVLTYTQYNRIMPRLAIATSDDLKHWVKHGSAFRGRPGWANRPTKSASIVCEIVNGELRAAKVKGKYWMYFGERKLYLAHSLDLIHWQPGKVVYRPRPGKYDSQLTEAGPPAVITQQGVVLLYNGKNATDNGDSTIPAGTYTVGQLLFDKHNFSHLKSVTERPCFYPQQDFERTGQYAAGTTFAEGLVLFHEKWYLYYGCADSFVGVAVSK
jgi:predicted GH43/DUF377 family glycosyl hydrolase